LLAAAAAAAGLTLQLCGIGMLFGWQDAWAANGEVTKGIVFVTAAQMLCGVAKDLTKLGGKTVTKLVTPDEREVRAGWPDIIITLLLDSMPIFIWLGCAGRNARCRYCAWPDAQPHLQMPCFRSVSSRARPGQQQQQQRQQAYL